MKIVLLGYGKMGRYIESLALADGDEILLAVDEHNRADVTADDLRPADVAIDFSRPDAAEANIELALAAGLPVVVGTTGWLDRLPQVRQRVRETDGALFYASNFSVGVNIFFQAAQRLARQLSAEGYRASIEETHHTEKLDAPSGTAITLRDAVQPEMDGQQVGIESFREPEVPGTHRLLFESDIDSLELIHTARSREGFARGALSAARWLPGRKGVFTMSDLLGSE